MKKVIRLTENDLARIVRRVIREQEELASVEDALNAHATLQLTYRSNPEMLEASYGRLIPVLVKAIQELSAEVETLKNR